MTPSRRGYWLSMAALVVALPAALAARTWGDVKDWRAEHVRKPVPGAVGEPIDYAGASWTITRFIRLEGSQSRAVVLAEFEAVIPDPLALSAIPCQVRLSDDEGREWQPTFISDRAIRRLYPEASERSLCGGPAFAAAEPGKPARMVASFSIPASAHDLTLSITLYSARPQYLSFSEPRT
jgi:hypothetical protein